MIRLAVWAVALLLTPSALTLVWISGAWVAEKRRARRTAGVR